MTPVFTSSEIIRNIEVLTEEKKRESKKIVLLKWFQKNKIKSIDDKLKWNWNRLYEFYPDFSDIKDISIFRLFLQEGFIVNLKRTALIGSTIVKA